MTDLERNAMLRILELLIDSSETGFKKVPAAFRPPKIEKNLAEAKDILERVKRGEFG